MSLALERTETSPPSGPTHISGPVVDFLLLGGSSLLLFPILLAIPADLITPAIVAIAFVLTQVINLPHFAASYRIFYEDFGRKVSGVDQQDPTLRFRYMFAGIVAPTIVLGGLLVPLATNRPDILAYGWNVMVFFVGWHYVKQGYGMAMVDAALKKRFLSGSEKKTMLVNSYAVWVMAWMLRNRTAKGESFKGILVAHIPIPDVVFWLTVMAVVASTAATARVLFRRVQDGTPTAWSGMTAYLIALYAWLVLMQFSVIVLLIAPLLHSLQYLFVVRRFQTNRHAVDPSKRTFRSQYWRSMLLGGAMFWIVPITLDVSIGVDVEAFGVSPFTFIAFVMVNIHHYLLDNVMWRRGNPEVSRHLFATA